MTLVRRSRLLATLLAGCLLPLASCGDTPTELSPLPRAVGEVGGVLLRFEGLQPLDQGLYHAWALQDRTRTRSLGAFNISASGEIVDENGAPVEQFTGEDVDPTDVVGLLITIEPQGAAAERASGLQILSGNFVDGVARLSVPFPSEVTGASGSVRIFTPTDGPDSNETSGLWFVDDAGDPSLDLPVTTQALQYELFVEVDGRQLPSGRFDEVDEPDSNNPFSGEEPPPDAPGEDYLVNAPEGMEFPLNLGGARVTISLEGRANDFVLRSQLIVLEVVLPTMLRGGHQFELINRTSDLPTGTAVLF